MTIWPFIVLPLSLAYLWFLTGALLGWSRGYPLAATVDTWARERSTAARGWRTGVIWHSVAWPWALKGCKENHGELLGHWCRFVEYPDGHYTLDQVVRAAVYREHMPASAPTATEGGAE